MSRQRLASRRRRLAVDFVARFPPLDGRSRSLALPLPRAIMSAPFSAQRSGTLSHPRRAVKFRHGSSFQRPYRRHLGRFAAEAVVRGRFKRNEGRIYHRDYPLSNWAPVLLQDPANGTVWARAVPQALAARVSHRPPALQRTGQRNLIRILQVAAHRQPARQPRHGYVDTGQLLEDIRGGVLALQARDWWPG